MKFSTHIKDYIGFQEVNYDRCANDFSFDLDVDTDGRHYVEKLRALIEFIIAKSTDVLLSGGETHNAIIITRQMTNYMQQAFVTFKLDFNFESKLLGYLAQYSIFVDESQVNRGECYVAFGRIEPVYNELKVDPTKWYGCRVTGAFV